MFKLISALLLAASLVGCASAPPKPIPPNSSKSFTAGETLEFDDPRVKASKLLESSGYRDSRNCSYDLYEFAPISFFRGEVLWRESYVKDACSLQILAAADTRNAPNLVQLMEEGKLKADEFAKAEKIRIAREQKEFEKAEAKRKAAEKKATAAAAAARIAKLRANGGVIVTSQMDCRSASLGAAMFGGSGLLGAMANGMAMSACSGGYSSTRFEADILNDAPVHRVDAKVTCSFSAPSGTVLGKPKTITIYEKWAPNQIRSFAFRMEMPEHATKANCYVGF